MYNKQIALRKNTLHTYYCAVIEAFFFWSNSDFRTCIKIQTAVFAYEGSLDQVRKAKLLVTVCDEGPSWKGSPSIYEH